MMKKKWLVMLLLGVMGVSMFTACSDDDEKKEDWKPNKDKLESYITKHNWFLYSIRQVAKNQESLLDIDGDGKVDKNLDNRKECEKDNFTKFNEDGTFFENTFNNVCSEYGEKPHSNIVSGFWRIKKDTLFLEFSDGDVEEFEINYDYTNPSNYNNSTKVMELIRTMKLNDTNYKVFFTYANNPNQ